MPENTKLLEKIPSKTSEPFSPSPTPSPVPPSDFGLAAIQGAAGNMSIQRAARAEGGEDAPVRSGSALNFLSVAAPATSVTSTATWLASIGLAPSDTRDDTAEIASIDAQLASLVITDTYRAELEQRRAEVELVAELRKAGPRTEMMIDAPRYNVEIAPDDPVLGTASATVTMIEFSDFQCPFCQRVMPTLKQLRDTYGDRVRIVWKDFPLTSIHPQAFKAAEAGQCAREQGKFWEYHDRLFANQQALEPELLKKHAVDTGLDAAKFNACLDTAKYAERVQAQMGVGNQLGVSSTPSVFINGRMVSGAQPYETFTTIIDEELERARR